MVLASDLAVFPVMFARAFGGDFLTKKFELVPDPAAMEQGLTVLRGMFEAGLAAPQLRHDQERRSGHLAAAGPRGLHRAALRRGMRSSTIPSRASFPGKIKAVEFPVSAGSQRQDPDGVGRRGLGHGDPEERHATRSWPGSSSARFRASG